MMRGHVCKRIAPADPEHHFHLLLQLIRPRPVALIDHVQLGDLHDASLERLDAVARFGHEDQHRCLGRGSNVELGLSDPDRLDQDAIESECLQDVGDFFGGGRETALRAARRHRANEDARVEAHRLHPNAVAEERTAGKGTGGIDSDHGDFEAALPVGTHQLFGEGALPGAGRAGDTDALRAALPDALVDFRQDALEPVALVLDQTDGARERSGVAARQSFEHRIESHTL